MTDSITHLEAEIAKAKKQAADRIAKLKRQAAAEQRKVDLKIVDLLHEQHPELHARLTDEARHAIADVRAKRSARRSSKDTTPTEAGRLDSTASSNDGSER